MIRRFVRRVTVRLLAPFAVLGLAAACSSDSGTEPGGDDVLCSIRTDLILAGQRRDGIPALTHPQTALPGEAGTEYLDGDHRVIGIVVGGQPLALPINILWWHEVVNLEGEDYSVVVTHCPLTGSSLAFDRAAVGGLEFGVSGLLFQTNLIMFDRNGGPDESLWPQMLRGARCGSRDGTDLPMVPIVEVTWDAWQEMHPDTRVLTSNTGHRRNYRVYPYPGYDALNSQELLFPIERSIDTRRPPKERALGIPDGRGGVVYPYGSLDQLGSTAVVSGVAAGRPHVVFWEADRQGAMAYRPVMDGTALTFSVDGDRIVDDQTGSEWRFDGLAIDGPLAGSALEPVAEAFVAYWFAWPVFYPDLTLWSAS